MLIETIRKLRRGALPKSESTVRYRDARGRLRFKGNGKALKSTQVYPQKFGTAVP